MCFLCLLVCFISRVEAVDISMDFERCEVPSFSVVRSLKTTYRNCSILTAIPCVKEYKHILKVKNGIFRGIDNGEWGGNVTFSSTDIT